MKLEVRWFCAYAIDAGALTPELCKQLAELCGNDCELMTFAQAVLENELVADVEACQNWVNYSHGQAHTGEVPPTNDIFAESASLVADVAAAVASTAVASTASDDDEWADDNDKDEWADDEDEWADDPTHVEEEVQLGSFDSLDSIPELEDIGHLNKEQAGALLKRLLFTARDMKASDLHLSAGSPPFVRKYKQIHQFGHVLTEESAMTLNTALLTEEEIEKFVHDQDYDFALSLDDNNRFRVNLMTHKTGIAGTYRLVPDHIPTLEELGFGRHVATINKLLDFHYGLILVTGPVGSGKTTTLAALVAYLNTHRQDHIITVEDPIEIVQMSRQCNLTQREVGQHTNSFHSALKGALRQDPDIIVIGELRDLETIENAITAAETGHLVIGTLHTSSAVTTLHRLLDVFPPDQQSQIRAMTAESLRGIICQRLMPNSVGTLSLVVEILLNTDAVSNNISDGNTHQLAAILQTGLKAGMCAMEQSILDRYLEGALSPELALRNMKENEFIKQVQINEAQKAQRIADEAKKANKKGWFR
ncbi:MAG: twitching motility protein PilT [Rhodothermales bacterium]|jgi:twitching motility protein PilT